MSAKLGLVSGLAVALVLSVSGCASVPGLASFDSSDQLPEKVELTHVAFYSQTQDQCGPAALASVLHHAGVAQSLEQLQAEVYVPQRQGSLPLEMLGAVRRAGVVPYVLKTDPLALWQELAAGHPVVVLQNLRWDWLPVWHYAVLVGYDQTADSVVLRSGDEKRRVMPRADFELSWAKAKHWAFVALPADQLPATASAAAFVQAAITLERVAPDQAALAYQTALKAWPDNLEAQLALGNRYYRQGALEAARTHYEQATRDHPDAADAWNNLAQVLLETHQWESARAAITQAVNLGGPRLERYQTTQTAIAKREYP